MKERNKRRTVSMFCFFGLVLTFFIAAGSTFAQCEKVTDAQIVSDIYARIKANKSLASQVSHINVVSSSQAVKLQGWTNSTNDYNTVYNFAMTENCVRVVNVNSFSDVPPDNSVKSIGGCASGTKACGDVCIPENDVCNITGFLGGYTPMFRLDQQMGFVLFEPVSACWQ